MLESNMGDQKRPDTMLEDMLQALSEQVHTSKNQSQELREVLGKLINCTLGFEEPQPEDDRPMASPNSHVEILRSLISNLVEVNNRNKEMIQQFQQVI